jgi:hypothetical protein
MRVWRREGLTEKSGASAAVALDDCRIVVAKVRRASFAAWAQKWKTHWWDVTNETF